MAIKKLAGITIGVPGYHYRWIIRDLSTLRIFYLEKEREIMGVVSEFLNSILEIITND
jgi:hypothetical protein